MNLQPQYQPASFPSDNKLNKIRKVVQVFHPEYKPAYPLLSLRATDDGALCYIIIYYACCIIAGNIWDASEGRTTGPFLSTSSDPSTAQRYIPQNYVIPAGTYYFHVPKSSRIDSNHTQPYPIVPNFHDWVFPESVPQPWRDVANNSPDRRTDSLFDPERAKCVITAQLNGLESAHMMPSTTQAWLRANRMRRFIDEENPDATHHVLSNKIPLREDYHSLWDDNFLILIPKPDASLQGRYRLTSHLLALPKKHYNTNTEAHVLFHNRPCYPFPHVPIELVFARFAWALFTRNVIKLFTDNVGDELYSVLSLEVDEQGNSVQRQEMRTVKQLTPLTTKATGGRRPTGEKRPYGQISKGYSHVEENNDEYWGQMEPDSDAEYPENWSYSPRTGQMEPDSDPEYPIARKRRAGNWIFSPRTGQLELDTDNNCGYGYNDSSDGNDREESEFDDDDTFSGRSLFFSDNDNGHDSDHDSASGESDVEHDHTALEIRTKSKSSCPPANTDTIPDLSTSVPSLGSSDRSPSRHEDYFSGTPILDPVNGKGSFEHTPEDHID
ncbi:hypothetical protein K445DRAFT_316014 [Daldinia sp. EC12]|nr:hypothetical protein K445DRAFT_316014 [Daldinia sp. EC12]